MYYYRCEKGTEAYQVLSKLYRQTSDCIYAAAELAGELGAISFTTNSQVIGGIGSLRFIGKPDPKEYKVIDSTRSPTGKLYDCIPNIDTKEGAKIALRITKLPFIRMEDAMERLCITDKVDDMGDSFRFDIIPIEDWVYMKSDGTHGLQGLQEIEFSRYHAVEKYIRSER